jgi:hypothetical protein
MPWLSLLLLGVAGLPACFGADIPAVDGPWQRPPALPPPTGRVVRVRTEPQLQQALQNLQSDTTILIAPGVYELTRTLQVGGGVRNVALRGDTPDRGQVILRGRGMRNADFGTVPHGIMVNDAMDVLIANLSVGACWHHPVTLQGAAGCERVRLFNVRLFDAGEQFLKANPDGQGGGVDGCVVEYCVFEFTDTARHNYTQGMSCHRCAGWVVRNNLFRNIRGPKDDPNVGGCVDFWNGSRDTTAEGNVLVNCRMGIRFGIVRRDPKEGFHDHEGGIIRNNVIWRQAGAVAAPDGGIMVWDSPGTRILHNTVVLNGTYPMGAIEYRWSDGVTIARNLIDAPVWRREEAVGMEADNHRITDGRLFVNAAVGDLRLSPQAALFLGWMNSLPDCFLDLNGEKRTAKTTVGAYHGTGP